MKFFDYDLTTTLPKEILSKATSSTPTVINCLNPHSFVVAESDETFKKALLNSSILLPDGEGIGYAIWRMRHKRIKKIAGYDLHQQLLHEANANASRVFYMGSQNKVLRNIEQRIKEEYPNIEVQSYSPSFCQTFSDRENSIILNHINNFSPDILFVGLTAPKQEKWVYRNLSRLTTPTVIASIGGVFDFYARTIKRAPAWIVKLRIEWLYRLLREPRRMWRRTVVSVPQYLRYIRQHKDQM